MEQGKIKSSTYAIGLPVGSDSACPDPKNLPNYVLKLLILLFFLVFFFNITIIITIFTLIFFID